MKEATKRVISNETSQDRSIRLKDAATRSAAKISNETLQQRSIRLKNATKCCAVKKSSKTSPEKASRLDKHDFASPESQNYRWKDII
jgi:hypothetical protein